MSIERSDKTYRVVYNNDNTLTVSCLGALRSDATLGGFYQSFDDLPSWAQHKLSALSIFDEAKPNMPSQTIEGVGRRITHNIFWIEED